MITEGDSVDEALDNAVDAFVTTLKLYENLGRALPDSIRVNPQGKATANASRYSWVFRNDEPKISKRQRYNALLFQSYIAYIRHWRTGLMT